jgi:hypothetical protein
MKRAFTCFWQAGTIAILCASMVVMTGCTVDQVLTDIDVALQTAQQVETAIGAISPADAAILEGLTGLAVSGLQAIQKDYDTYEASKNGNDLQKTLEAVKALQTNLPSTLAAAHIYSPAAQAKCAAWVNLTVTTLQAVTEALAPTPTASAASKTPTLPTAESIQARWLAEVCSGDTACGKLVKVHRKHVPHKWL